MMRSIALTLAILGGAARVNAQAVAERALLDSGTAASLMSAIESAEGYLDDRRVVVALIGGLVLLVWWAFKRN